MPTPKFAHIDTRKPDGFYIRFERIEIPDDSAGRPDENDDGFWPSADPDHCAYVAPEDFAEQMRIAEERMAAFDRGQWGFIGIRARAHCLIARNGVGTVFSLESAGLWGIEGDSGDEYLNSVFEDEKADLLDMIECMKAPILEKEAA